jgi:hypothetical protein
MLYGRGFGPCRTKHNMNVVPHKAFLYRDIYVAKGYPKSLVVTAYGL